jgi:glycosyltransferase involved in cell wall biosynthesis
VAYPKYNIAFVHSAIGQFKALHEHLNLSGKANSYALCSPGVYNAEHKKLSNLRVFDSVPQRGENLFFYITKIDEASRKSFGVKNSILELQKDVKLDLIVCHHSGGAPMQLFDEIDIPVISYIEFPSFRHYGWDEKYPPPDAYRYRDKLFEMYSMYDVIKADKVIVPSNYAKTMFPSYLQHKVAVQMEGFKETKTKEKPPFKKEKGKTYIGFTARDLSSAKGFEQFILIAKAILKERQNVKFIIVGSPKALYSYEGAHLDEVYGKGHGKEFKDYIYEREKIDTEFKQYFEHFDMLDYDKYLAFIDNIDFFLYPLQFGSANWGIYEIFCRGKIIIGSERCYVPELITDNIDGYICDYDNIPQWVERAVELIDHPRKHDYMKKNIEISKQKYKINNIADDYLELFHKVILEHRHKKEEVFVLDKE